MSAFLKAKSSPQFGLMPKWVKLHPDGSPSGTVKCPLEETKICFKKSSKSGEQSAWIHKDDGRHDPELFLKHVLPKLEQRVFSQFPQNVRRDEAFGKIQFNLTGQVLEDISLNYWQEMIHTDFWTKAGQMKAKFIIALQEYLEEIAGQKNLGDEIIRSQCTGQTTKPHWMTFREFLFRRQEVVGYVTKGWLRHTLDLPNQHDLAEAFFDAQPKAHKDKYMLRLMERWKLTSVSPKTSLSVNMNKTSRMGPTRDFSRTNKKGSKTRNVELKSMNTASRGELR